MVEQIGKNDVVVTTALVPGRKAPILVSEAAVAAMKPGSVIVDLAAEAGGNCALTVAIKSSLSGGVRSSARRTCRGRCRPTRAGFSRVTSTRCFRRGSGRVLTIDMDDEVAKAAVVARDGAAADGRSAVVTDIYHIVELLTVLSSRVFVGFEVISKVPTTLHTPLMSATNAIHGIVLGGAILIVAGFFSQ